MKARPRDISRPSARQRSQKPRSRSLLAAPDRPCLTSQSITFNRGANSIRYYAARSQSAKAAAGWLDDNYVTGANASSSRAGADADHIQQEHVPKRTSSLRMRGSQLPIIIALGTTQTLA